MLNKPKHKINKHNRLSDKTRLQQQTLRLSKTKRRFKIKNNKKKIKKKQCNRPN